MPPSRLTSLAATAASVVAACTSIRQAAAFSTSSTSSCDVSSKSCSSFTGWTPTHQIIQQHHSPAAHSLTMKVSSKSKRGRSNKSSHLIELNNERLSTAGRPGTKSFMDPNKLFIGNLHFDATESDIRQLFADYWGVPVDVVDERIESIKVIRDWKTGKSKGFGFLQFYEPMVATSTMVSMNQAKNKKGGWKIKGRTVRLDQGMRNREEEEKELQRRKAEKEKKKRERMARADLDEEGKVIHDALAGVDGRSGEEEEGMMSEDDMITFMEKGGLRGVMPLTTETAGFLGIEGMYEDDEEDDDHYSEFYGDNGYNDEDWNGGDLDEEEDTEDLENFVFDGDFEAEYNPNEYEALSKEEEAEMKQMNREQRREANKRRKKRKLPFKGFGSPN
mmetsp:Transcript_15487/g.26422  ORF Transcript_15487/g.26422 Transcript_15487/m.26422 type:complete len:390 (-) Transcript_15487:86-1255(-)